MLGALTWQATVIKMFLLCLRGEIARGLFVFSPGFSLLRPGLHLSSPYSPLGLHGTRSTIANLTWGYSATDISYEGFNDSSSPGYGDGA